MTKGKVVVAVLGFLAASLLYGEEITSYYSEFVAFLKENFNLLLYWLATTYLYGYPLLIIVLGLIVISYIVALIYLATRQREVI